MVSFARARTKSLLSILWPAKVQASNRKKPNLDISKEQIEKQQDQNNCFIEARKNGGMWFSLGFDLINRLICLNNCPSSLPSNQFFKGAKMFKGCFRMHI